LTELAEQTSTDAATSTSARRRKGSGLDAMVLPELKQLASTLGLKGTGAMRKGQLIDAIQSAQGGSGSTSGATGATRRRTPPAEPEARNSESRNSESRNSDVANALEELERTPRAEHSRREETPRSEPAVSTADVPAEAGERVDQGPDTSGDRRRRNGRDREGAGRDNGQPQARDGQSRDYQNRDNGNRETQNRETQNRDGQNRDTQNRDGQSRDNQSRDNQSRDNQSRDNQSRDNQSRDNGNQQSREQRDWDDDGNRRGRRRRSRDRQGRRNPRGGAVAGMERYEAEPTVSEDDVLVSARGILDVLDNYAFVRTSGYLPGSEDAYVSLSMVKRFGLRKGDVVTGVVKAIKDGERKEKFNPLVRLDTINGADPEQAKNRVEFNKLTPLYPQERLKLETTPTNMTGRIIDLVCPVGKGQRGLIVSPSKAGKTMIMQSIANAISTNNPEVHLMVVLVDERPEEVTDFQRAVQGEVIASTFDRPADDHTTVAELAIERAKRLVEAGRDVVVLLDGITRLGRAYNIAAPASGRILSGGVDSAALYPPKKFFGAARNIEGGGSLTILATALVETGSKMDEVIFEEFKGTGNMEVRLKREFSEKRIFPAIDVAASSTRREELLMGREELAIMWKLRRLLSGLDSLQGLEMLLDRLKKTNSNAEFLMAITKTMPS
jgi:transcription termination factor Rho